MNNPSQAREFVLEAWEKTHPFNPSWWQKLWLNVAAFILGVKYPPKPKITRAMIKELLEEEKDGKRVRDILEFLLALEDVLSLGGDINENIWTATLIFATLEDLIMAFALAYREG